MDKQTKAAIIAISIVIPLTSVAVLNLDQSIQRQESFVQTKQITAVASFYPVYEFTKQVGKDKVEVSLLVPSGIEPHDWEPTIRDLQKMQTADLIVVNGLGFEQWTKNFISANPDATIIDTSEGITPLRINYQQGNSEITTDPHIWLNPITIKIQIQNIAKALSQKDPQNKEFYQNNADSYIKELELLDSQIKSELTNCKKDFIAFHDSFSYFARQYGLNQHTVLKSIDPLADPSPADLEEIINLAKKLEIKIIFTEEMVNPRMSQVIADEIGGKILVLSPLEILDEKKSYLDRMEQNISNLKEALCT